MPLGRRVLAAAPSVEGARGVGDSLAALAPRAPEFSSFSQHQLHVLRVTSVSVASVSVAATMLATFWFVRMRRSFRHDLIILLIQSDMLQATWFVVFSAVELARGTVASGSPICQASGFFLALGIEACDVAVVLVGLHTALYIFRRGNGLYPYRRVAYCAFVLVPLLLASLAFINTPAYTNSGPYCYLPGNPDWTRRALSWIPRYVIIVTICVAYVSTYVYVTFLMKRFGRAQTAGREGLSTAGDPGHRRRRAVSVPPTPPIAYHGLIPPTTPPCENGSADRRVRNQHSHARPASRGSRGAHALEEQPSLAPVPENSMQRKRPAYGMDLTGPSHQREEYFSHPNLESRESCQSTLEEPPTSRDDSTPHDGPSTPLRPKPSAPRSFWKRSIARTASSSPSNVRATPHRGPRSSDSSESISLSPAALDATGMAKTRDRIRRQMRQLFIYPVMYILVWIVPFVNHVTPERASSFGLVLASLVSLCLQGIAYSLVFCLLEKPWRHPRRAEGEGWRFRGAAWPGRRAAGGATAANAGRTPEEMLVDSRIARRRRDGELAERRLVHLAPHAARHEWWDVPLERVEEPQDGGW